MAGRTIDGCTLVAGDASDGWLDILFMADRMYSYLCDRLVASSKVGWVYL